MSRFYIGQPVVCVNNKRSALVETLYPDLTWPTRGQRYHIRAYVPVKRGTRAVLLSEITNRVVTYMDGTKHEAGFAEARFEPITENQVQAIIAIATDMEIENA